jgi:hypothetical protein
LLAAERLLSRIFLTDFFLSTTCRAGVHDQGRPSVSLSML